MGSNPTEVKFSLACWDSQISFKGVIPKGDLVSRQYCLLSTPKHLLKGHCYKKAHVRSWLTPTLTNKNRNTITRAINSPRVSLECHVPFKILLSAGIWPFVCKAYLSCSCCVKAVSVEYKYKHFTFFQLACTSRMFVLPSFLRFFFLSKQTAPGWK